MKPTAYLAWSQSGQYILSFYKPTDLQTEVTELYSADTVKKALEECRQKTLEAMAEHLVDKGLLYDSTIEPADLIEILK